MIRYPHGPAHGAVFLVPPWLFPAEYSAYSFVLPPVQNALSPAPVKTTAFTARSFR